MKKREEQPSGYPELTRQQQIMLILFAREKAGLAEITRALPGDAKMQTVQGLLNALMEKRLVRRYYEEGAYVYVPCVVKSKAHESFQRRLLAAFSENSGIKLLKSLLAFGFVSPSDLKSALQHEGKEEE